MSEEEIFDGIIQNYIAEHTTTEKYYTQKYVDEIKEERDKYKIVLDKIKEILKDPDRDGFDDDGYDDSYYDMIYTERIKELLEEIE